MTFDFSAVWLYKEVLIGGLLITLGLTAISMVLGTIFGLVLALMKISHNSVLRRFASLYIDLFRSIPIIVLLIWMYYALPMLTNIRMDAFWTGVLGLSLVLAAYAAEIMRTGIESVPEGQVNAAYTLGMTKQQTMRRIILPQALRQMLPPLTGMYTENLKNSTLTAIIAVNEILHVGQILISQTYRPMEIYTSIAVIFICILLPITYFLKKFEIRNLNGAKDDQKAKRFWI
jgi:polar amino acid transport system permease protein